MVIDRSDHLAAHRQSAFTLIEVVFVVTLISVLMCWVVPNVKKAYKDMKMKETFSHIDTLIASVKAFYLIDNEFPEDGGTNYVKVRSAWCLPSSYYDRNLNEGRYKFNIQPYGARAYDLDNCLGNQKHKQFYITVFRQPDAYEWHMRLVAKYPTYSHNFDDNNYAAGLSFFPNLNEFVEDDVNYRNRFY